MTRYATQPSKQRRPGKQSGEPRTRPDPTTPPLSNQATTTGHFAIDHGQPGLLTRNARNLRHPRQPARAAFSLVPGSAPGQARGAWILVHRRRCTSIHAAAAGARGSASADEGRAGPALLIPVYAVMRLTGAGADSRGACPGRAHAPDDGPATCIRSPLSSWRCAYRVTMIVADLAGHVGQPGCWWLIRSG
jgi:hypothetical protein